jgi:hypothetical protein
LLGSGDAPSKPSESTDAQSRLQSKQRQPDLSHPMNAYEHIVFDLAGDCTRRIARRVVRRLQRSKELLSGDDSPLQSTWEEICTQVQFERSLYWSTYDEFVLSCVEADLPTLQTFELQAISLQTGSGTDWSCDDEADNKEAPVFTLEVVEHVAREVYAMASGWSNPRIRDYIDRSAM